MKARSDEADDLSCKELVELVTDYLEGALSATDVSRFEHHLEECPECGAHLDQMRLIIEASAWSVEGKPSTATVEPLMRAFRRWKSGRGI